ncbi:MAG TPA: HEPN domain-containing protein [Tangfeifania sp.]|nr:HEPN domain-containing protein [Tangfeifania sp.]
MLNIPKQIAYWTESADDDIETAEILIEKGKFIHGLFFCHLSIEKIIKALVVKETREIPPKSHDIFYLAEKANVTIPEDSQVISQILMKYQLEGRYPEYFPSKPQPDSAKKYLIETQKFLKWLKTML